MKGILNSKAPLEKSKIMGKYKQYTTTTLIKCKAGNGKKKKKTTHGMPSQDFLLPKSFK